MGRLDAEFRVPLVLLKAERAGSLDAVSGPGGDTTKRCCWFASCLAYLTLSRAWRRPQLPHVVYRRSRNGVSTHSKLSKNCLANIDPLDRILSRGHVDF